MNSAIAVAVLALGAQPAMAWGPLGHRIVARIAQERLSARAQEAIAELFGDPGALEAIATCADDVLRSTAPVRCAKNWLVPPDRERATESWHFINLPISDERPTVDGYCPEGRCVVAQTRRHLEALASAGVSPEERRAALMVAVHLIADLHQPLHCADDGDLGGNGKWVTFRGVRKRLHELWDDLLLSEGKDAQRAMDPAPLARRARRLIRAKDPARWTQGDFIEAAALESHGIAASTIYPAYRADSASELGRAYHRRLEPVALRRLAQAGVRLAAALELALAPR